MRIYLFSPKLEKIYFTLLFIFVFASLMALTDIIPKNFVEKNSVLFSHIVAYVLFNTTHTIYTHLMIIFLPEVRGWIWAKIRSIRFISIASALAVIAYAAIIRANGYNNTTQVKNFLEYIFLILLFAHNISQTKGLSLIYNRLQRPYLNAAEVFVQEKIEQRERFLFDIFIVFRVFLPVWSRFGPESLQPLARLETIFMVSLSFLIILNSLSYPRVKKSSKRMFLFGNILYSLQSMTYLAFLTQRALHGLEYLFLSSQMTTRSAARWPIWKITMVTIFTILILIFAYLGYHASIASALGISDVFKIWFLVIAIILEYSHYYLDSILFQLKDLDVKKTISPLLFEVEKKTD